MLAKDLKVRIIESLRLEDITPEQIDDDAPLFGAGLGLDSIDALELVVMLEKITASSSRTSRKAARRSNPCARWPPSSNAKRLRLVTARSPVITGLGIVSAAGCGTDEVWNAIRAGNERTETAHAFSIAALRTDSRRAKSSTT